MVFLRAVAIRKRNKRRRETEGVLKKVSPLQAMEAHGDVDARVHIFTATALGRGYFIHNLS